MKPWSVVTLSQIKESFFLLGFSVGLCQGREETCIVGRDGRRRGRGRCGNWVSPFSGWPGERHDLGLVCQAESGVVGAAGAGRETMWASGP